MSDFTIATNRRAWYEYEILEKLEAGLVLSGIEIKAVRAKKVNLAGSFVRLRYGPGNAQPEATILNLHIGTGVQPTRTRQLLLHRHEINKLIGKLEEKRLTMIPLRFYLKRGLAKLELGLARGKQLHSKRESKRRKDIQRDIDRTLREKA
ncbi:SsrA-binding protein SmpB [Candidatus Berkelbacteria bacterium]|nr:SsrA-binding protein SmpB [Candidatus Berkelbacteria bacterium]